MKEETKMGYFNSSSLVKLIMCFSIPLIVVSWFASSMSNNDPPSSSWGFSSSNYHPFSPSTAKTSSNTRKGLRSKIEGVVKEAGVVTKYTVLSTPTPHLAIEANGANVFPQAVNETSKEVLKSMSPNSTDNIVIGTSNETRVSPMRKVKLEKVATHLDKLEHGLQMARIAIKKAKYTNQTYDDPYYKPMGPMYWNSNAFHRSYIEMEKRFKVFVYEEGEAPLFHNGPCKSIYSSEGNFIHLMENNVKFRTKNPDKAHVFFLPFSVTMMVHFVYLRDSRDFGPIRASLTMKKKGLVHEPFWYALNNDKV